MKFMEYIRTLDKGDMVLVREKVSESKISVHRAKVLDVGKTSIVVGFREGNYPRRITAAVSPSGRHAFTLILPGQQIEFSF